MKANEWNLYIGQDVLIEGVSRLTLSHATDAGTGTCLFFTNGDGYVADDRCKVVLRTLDDMTDDERKEFSATFLDDESLNVRIIDLLTQKGFAIRQEFERGVAVKEEER